MPDAVPPAIPGPRSRPGPLPLTPFQGRIHDRLVRLTGPYAGAFFRTACRIANRPDDYDVPVNLVYHCMREVQSAIMDVLLPAVDKAGLEVTKPTKKSKKKGNAEASASEDFDEEDFDRGRARIAAAGKYLGLQGDLATGWQVVAGKLHGLAHRAGLGTPRKWPQNSETFERLVNLYDSVLPLVEDKFLQVLVGLDHLLSQLNPGKSGAKALMKHAPNTPPVLFTLFEQLGTPDWFRAFAKIDAFAHPPATIEDSGGRRFPPWPQLKLAELVVKQIPDEVAKVLDGIRNVRNPAVSSSLLKIAFELPAKQLALLARTITTWLDVDSEYPLGPELGKIIDKLIDGNEVKAASALLEHALDLDPGEAAKEDLQSMAYMHPSSVGRINEWEYGELVRNQLAHLWKRDPKEGLAVTSTLLRRGLSTFNKGREGNDVGDRASSAWMPDLMEKLGDREDSPIRLLAGTLAQETQGAVTAGKLAAKDAAQLTDQDDDVHHRLRMILLSNDLSASVDDVAKILRKPEEQEKAGRIPEFWTLAKSHFGRLDDADKKRILKWIEEGSDADEFESWLKRQQHPNPADEARRFEEQWQRDRLAVLEPHLNKEGRDRLNNLLKRGKPRSLQPEEPRGGHGWVGPTSPFTKDQLAHLDIPSLLQTLNSWVPREGWQESSPAGLGRVLETVVAERPAEFSKHAKSFIGSRGSYINAVLDGLSKAVPSTPIDWEAALELAKAAADADDEERNWDDPPASPRAALRLLEAGLRIHANSLPEKLRKSVWAAIEAAGKAPPPRPLTTAAQGRRDVYTDGINSDRGRAFETAILYADWIRRSTKDFRLTKDAPEVAALLDQHLASGESRSEAVQSIFGVYAPFLSWWDKDWFERNRNRIFPNDGGKLHEAAWGSYLRYAQRFTDSIKSLEREYVAAVDRLAQQPTEAALSEDEKHLIEHILSFYRHGSVSLDEGSVLWKILHTGPASARRHSTQLLAHHAPRQPEELQPAEAALYRAYWEKRRVTLEARFEDPDAKAELALFGWWVRFAPLPPDWILAQLSWALKAGIEIAEPYMWVDRLEEWAETHPTQVSEVLLLLVKQAESAADVYTYHRHLRPVLEKLIQQKTSQKTACLVVNKLLAHGFHEFRDLVEDQK